MRHILFALLPAVMLAQPVTAQDVPRPVKTEVIGAEATLQQRQFFGTVVARQTVDLAFQVGGQIVEFPVLEGTPVTEGSVIARLDPEPFEIALHKAEANKAQADRALARLEGLSRANVSEASLQDGQTASELAALALRDASRAQGQATLTAPFDALVASRLVANFTTVSAGTPVVRLHDVSEWRVKIKVPEVLFRYASANEKFDLELTFPGDDRHIPLVPRELTAEASAVGQTFTITLALTEDPGPGILPGSSGTVLARFADLNAAVVVPPTAVVTAPNGETALMVFDPDGAAEGTVRRVPVTLGAGPNGEITVTSGIEAGAEIIVAGAQAVENGQRVRRFDGFGN